MFFIKITELNTNSRPLFWGISKESWSLIIPLVVGFISAIAIIYASYAAISWNKRNKKEKEYNEISYFLGCFQILAEIMNYYFYVYLVGEDIEGKNHYSIDYLISQIKLLISEIDDSKFSLAQLFSPYINSKTFLYLLFDLSNIFSAKRREIDDDNSELEEWDELIKRLEKFNSKMEKIIK